MNHATTSQEADPARSPRDRARRRRAVAALGFALASYGVAALGGLAMRGRGGPDRLWFRSLRKPSFQPPDRVFGPVWTILYGVIAYSGWRIWKRPSSRRRTAALGLWAAQLILNGAWTPIFFGVRRPRAALVDLIALDAVASAYMLTAARVDRTASRAFVPYVGWLGFATALNARIVAKNPNALLAP